MKKEKKRGIVYKHLLIRQETHAKVIALSKKSGMTVDGLIKNVLLKTK